MTEETYTPEEDVTEAGADGIQRLMAAKGVPIPMEEAKRLGLVKDKQQTGPRELKEGEGSPKDLARFRELSEPPAQRLDPRAGELQPRDLAPGEMLEAGELPAESTATEHTPRRKGRTAE